MSQIGRFDIRRGVLLIDWPYPLRFKLDPYNGLALTPTFDLLVDRGYLSFENNGDLILSSTLTQNEISQLELPDDFRLEILNDSQRSYIKYHRTEILKR